MTFDPSDLLHSSPLLLLTVAGLLLLMLDAFSRVRLVGPDYHHKLPAETSEAVAVPVAGSRNYLMPLTVLTLLATLMLLGWQTADAGGSGVHMYRDMLVLDRFGLMMS